MISNDSFLYANGIGLVEYYAFIPHSLVADEGGNKTLHLFVGQRISQGILVTEEAIIGVVLKGADRTQISVAEI